MHAHHQGWAHGRSRACSCQTLSTRARSVLALICESNTNEETLPPTTHTTRGCLGPVCAVHSRSLIAQGASGCSPHSAFSLCCSSSLDCWQKKLIFFTVCFYDFFLRFFPPVFCVCCGPGSPTATSCFRDGFVGATQREVLLDAPPSRRVGIVSERILGARGWQNCVEKCRSVDFCLAFLATNYLLRSMYVNMLYVIQTTVVVVV